MNRVNVRSKILITGAGGFIGNRLVKHLLAQGYINLIAIDNLTNGSFSEFSSGVVDCRKVDILDSTNLRDSLKGVDAVIHLAADTRVIDSILDPVKNFEVNVAGTFNLLCLMKDLGIKHIISASTGGAILGSVKPPVSEGMVPNPISPYGASKLANEGYLNAFTECFGLRAIALRFSNVYGPGSIRKGSVVAAFCKNILRKEPIVIYGDGTQQRDFVFINDIVEGIEAALKSNLSGVFQLGTGLPVSIRELLIVLEDVVGKKIMPAILYRDFRSGEIHSTWCDIQKAIRELNYAPKTSLQEGIQQTWAWFASNAKALADL